MARRSLGAGGVARDRGGALRAAGLLTLVWTVTAGAVGVAIAGEVVVGVAAPLSGRMAEAGRALEAGAREAAQRINAAGGVLGEAVAVAVADDTCSGAGGGAAAHELVTAGAVVVIGHPCGSAAVAAARIYADSRVPFLATSRHPAVTERGGLPTVLRIVGRDDQQGADIAAFLLAQADAGRIAVVHDRTAYGRGIAQSVSDALTAAGRAPVLAGTFVAGEKDYGDTVRAIVAAGAGTVVLGGFPSEAALILRQLRAAGSRAQLVAGEALATPEFAELAGGAAEGALVALPLADPARTAAEAVEMWARAATAAGTTEAAKVAAAVREGTAAIPGRVLRFDAAGNADVRSYALHRWTAGRLEPLPAPR